MKSAKKKFLSAIAVFAVSSATVCGALSFAGCANRVTNTTEDTIQRHLYTVSSAMGEREVEASGKIYYVSPTGIGTEGTQENPASLSIINAVAEESILQPGDTVILKDGVYEQDSTIRLYVSGEYNKPITVKAEHPGKATISMYKQGWGGRGVQINGSFINFIGINVCGSGDNGIYVGGSYNLVENCELYDNRDTGLQIGRGSGSDNTVDKWPSYNLIKNCSSHNNYDNQTYGENADGYAAKLTLGYGNVFDGCIAYRNSDDGWDLFAKRDTGNLGQVIIYNCVAYENGYLENTQEVSNARYGTSFDTQYAEANQNSYTTRDGDGNGFKLGGESMYGDVFLYNCLSFGNRMHGFTDNSNPGYLSLKNCTAVDNGAAIDNNSESATFGQIIDKASGTHANYDVSRQSYSYNHIDHSLSAQTAMGAHDGLVSDKYRGSVSDSLLIGYTIDGGKYTTTKTAYKITDSIDADSKRFIGGTAQSSLLDSSAIFEKYHVEVGSTTIGEGEEAVTTKTYQYNVSGKDDRNAGENGDNRAHLRFRNADGSINMGDVYKIKDYSPLLGDGNKIGVVLNLETYADYKHYAMSDFTNSETFETAVDVRLQAACDMLYLQTDEDGVYQDFRAVTKIYGCEVSWTSSNTDILKVTKTYWGSDLSKAEYAPIQVTRPTDADTEVTLTATVHYFGKTQTRDFVVNVKKDTASIGEISVIGPTGDKIENGNSIIVDRFTVLKDPVMTVLNGADYSGKQLTVAQADFTTKYEYAEDIAALNNGSAQEVKGFTTSATGAFKVTMKVQLKSTKESVEFVYYVLVASNTANISFLNNQYNLVVNAEGYNLSGDLTSAIGTLYSYSSTEAVTDITADYIKEHGTSHTFRATRISFNFPNANAGAYHVYSVFANGNGEITSDIYHNEVGQVEISTKDQFKDLAQGKTTTESTKIYVLTQDLDFEGEEWTLTDKIAEGAGLSGLFNGGGHKISNLTVNGASSIENVAVFRSLTGGTITNITFENITTSGSANRVGGIVGVMYSGTVSYVQVKNVSVTSTSQRVGALIGQILTSNESADYVDYSANIHHVSIVNDMTKNEDGSYKYGVFANTRVGGIVGLIQSGTSTYYVDVTISDCYVKSFIGGTGGDYQGGIVGMLDARSQVTGKDRLEIINCYTDNVIFGNRRTAGIYGGTNGAYGTLIIANCASTSTILNNAYDKPITAPNSNDLSSVVGRGGHAQVSDVAALFADRNYNSALTLLTADSIKVAETWTALGFDLENDWTLDTTNGGITLKFTVA
ncbi:MAG: hypothetical protein K2L12_04375 [Clostridia bacterium]|nr:hypothetical protein [Clostridia bacterium]